MRYKEIELNGKKYRVQDIISLVGETSNLNRLYDLDSDTKDYLHNNTPLENKKALRRYLYKDEEKYFWTHESPFTNEFSKSVSALTTKELWGENMGEEEIGEVKKNQENIKRNKRIEGIVNKRLTIDLFGKATFNIGDLEFSIDNWKNTIKRASFTTELLFLYCIYKLNSEGIAYINNREYMKVRKLNDADKSSKALKRDFEILGDLARVTHNKPGSLIKDILFSTHYSHGRGILKASDTFREYLKAYSSMFMYLPKQIFRMQGKMAKRLVPLAVYIYQYARINAKYDKFELNISKCLYLMGFMKEENVNNRNQDRLIKEAFENILDILSEELKGLMSVECKEGYKTFEDFKNGKIVVTILDDCVIKYHTDMSNQRESHRPKTSNRNQKIAIAKKRTLELHKKGKSVKDISKELRISEKTIRKYLKPYKTQ